MIIINKRKNQKKDIQNKKLTEILLIYEKLIEKLCRLENAKDLFKNYSVLIIYFKNSF